MGYRIDVTVRNVRIPADRVDACLAAVNQLLSADAPDWIKQEHALRCYDYQKDAIVPGAFAWVFGPRPPATQWATLAEAFLDWHYASTVSADGVTLDRFIADKMGDEEVLWRAIAPFVAAHSNAKIDVDGEDSERWRYVFQNGAVGLFFSKNGDVWERILFLAEEKYVKERIEKRLAGTFVTETEEVDVDRFSKVEDRIVIEKVAEDTSEAPEEIDSQRFRVMAGTAEPEPVPTPTPDAPAQVVARFQRYDLDTNSWVEAGPSLILPVPTAAPAAPSPTVVRLLGVRSRGVQ